MSLELTESKAKSGRGARRTQARNRRPVEGAAHGRRASGAMPAGGVLPWDMGDDDLWEEMDWVARECGLTSTEKAVLSLARLDSHTEAEIAEELGLTQRAVTELLVDALRKARARFEHAASPRSLFWEEVRQKSRCIYQKRRIGWLR